MVEFLGLWESLHDSDFKRIEFDTFKENAGMHTFVFSIKDRTEKLGELGRKKPVDCFLIEMPRVSCYHSKKHAGGRVWITSFRTPIS